jgi:hypothetical protein
MVYKYVRHAGYKVSWCFAIGHLRGNNDVSFLLNVSGTRPQRHYDVKVQIKAVAIRSILRATDAGRVLRLRQGASDCLRSASSSIVSPTIKTELVYQSINQSVNQSAGEFSFSRHCL